MDCDTTGVEPDFALMKFKKLAGGGYMKIANQSIGPALQALGYEDSQVNEIIQYVIGSMSLENSPYKIGNLSWTKGFSEMILKKLKMLFQELLKSNTLSMYLYLVKIL